VAPTAKKLNFLIRDDIARELAELVPPGERSKVVNEALARELLAIRRRTITERLRAARERGPALGTEKIVASLRKDRERP
jgi:predicted metal-dependent phosphoesterase TrpH